FGSVTGHFDGEARDLQVAAHDVPHGLVVVDHQYPARLLVHHPHQPVSSRWFTASAVTACPASHQVRRGSNAVIGSSHAMNGSQIRSVSAFDRPDRSANTIVSSAASPMRTTGSAKLRPKSATPRREAATTAGPAATATAARSAQTQYEYGRTSAT